MAVKIFLIKTLFYKYKVFGLATMKMNVSVMKNTEKPDVFFTHTKGDVFYNIILIVTLLIFEYVYILDTYQFYNLSHLNNFERTLENIRWAFVYLSLIIIIIKYCVQKAKATRLINEILSLEKSLIIFNKKEYYKQKSLACCVTLICLTNITMQAVIIVTNETELYRGEYYFMFKYFPALINNYLIIQYTILLKLLNRIFKAVNNNFHLILNEVQSENEIILGNNFSRLHNLHFSVCKLSEELSDFYSQPILFCVLYMFISFILYSFYSSKPIVLGISTMPTILYIHCLFRVFHHFLLFLFLTKSVTDVISEVSKQINFYYFFHAQFLFLAITFLN